MVKRETFDGGVERITVDGGWIYYYRGSGTYVPDPGSWRRPYPAPAPSALDIVFRVPCEGCGGREWIQEHGEYVRCPGCHPELNRRARTGV